MDPSHNHFSWATAITDIHRFAQDFGIDLNAQPGRSASSDPMGSPPNLEHLPSSDHDTLNHAARQEHADYVSPSTPGYSQASAPPQYPEHGTSASAEFEASQNHGQYSDLNYHHESPDSFDFSPLYGTPASAEHSSSEQLGYSDHPNYLHESSSSFDSTPLYGTTSTTEGSSFQQYSHNDYPNYRNAALGSAYSIPLYETSASAGPSSSQQYGQNSPTYEPTEDQDYRIPVHPRDNSLSSDHAYEPAQISHSQDVDHARLQELHASLAMPFPRFWAPGFDSSILSKSFNAFVKLRMSTVLKIAVLGKHNQDLDRPNMLRIFQLEGPHAALPPTIKAFNKTMARNNIGQILERNFRSSYSFIKGENYHYVDVIYEAYSIISHDFRTDELPLNYVQILAMLYGQPGLSCEKLREMLNINMETLNKSVSKCNTLLLKNDSPVTIAVGSGDDA